MESADDEEDPEPATQPPEWAKAVVEAARALVGREVYPPSDDTFIMLEVLGEEVSRLLELRPTLCLEIGCGSGVLIACLVELLRGKISGSGLQTLPALIAVDKNPDAVVCTQSLLDTNNAPPCLVVQTAFFSGLAISGKVDVGLCNPPYVPTPVEEMEGTGISVSWAGGKRGRAMIDELLPEIVRMLAPGGLFYLVCVRENGPEDVLIVARGLGLKAAIVRRESRGDEELCVLRFEL